VAPASTAGEAAHHTAAKNRDHEAVAAAQVRPAGVQVKLRAAFKPVEVKRHAAGERVVPEDDLGVIGWVRDARVLLVPLSQ